MNVALTFLCVGVLPDGSAEPVWLDRVIEWRNVVVNLSGWSTYLRSAITEVQSSLDVVLDAVEQGNRNELPTDVQRLVGEALPLSDVMTRADELIDLGRRYIQLTIAWVMIQRRDQLAIDPEINIPPPVRVVYRAPSVLALWVDSPRVKEAELRLPEPDGLPTLIKLDREAFRFSGYPPSSIVVKH